MFQEKALTDSSAFPSLPAQRRINLTEVTEIYVGRGMGWMNECRHLDVRAGPLKRINHSSAAAPARRAFVEDSAEL